MNQPSFLQHSEQFDIARLPVRLQFAEGYTSDYVVFARSSVPDLMVTNLRAADVIPEEARALCTSSAELALIATTMAMGHSVAYLDSNDRGRERLGRWAPLFAAEFLSTLDKPEAMVLHVVGDLQKWLNIVSGRGCWWTRGVGDPPGTEFA